jgi:Domain of unknown function (DUF5122) beta-propeller
MLRDRMKRIMKIQFYKFLLIVIVNGAYPFFCEGQTTDTTFVKKLQRVGALIQTIQTADARYVSLCKTGAQDFMVRKIKASGQKIWERKIFFPTDFPYSLDAIAQTSDGGYILAGQVVKCFGFYCGYYYSNESSAILVKLRSNGSVEWKKEFRRFQTTPPFTSVVPVPGGGFVATAGIFLIGPESAFDLMKFTPAGNVVWTKTFTNSAPVDYTLVSGSDNGLILISGIPNGANVLKLNDSGGIVWKKSFEIPDFVFQTAKVTPDNRLVIAGKCANCNQLSLVRLETDGTVSWRAKYSLQPPRVHSITDLVQTPDSGYAINGTMGGNTGQNAKAFLLKIDSSRKVVFQQAFITGKVGGGSSFNTTDGGFLIFRQMGQDVLVSSVDSNGTVPGCNLFYSVIASSIPFGQLKVKEAAIGVVSPDALGISDIAATSTASNHSESTVCQ